VRFLLVDDDRQLFKMVSEVLSAHWRDVEVLYAATGEEALDIVERKQLDLVLLDIWMPGRSGYEVLQEIRGWSPVPVIMLTGAGEVRDKVQALKEGADDYITKPFDVQELIARVEAVLRRAGTQPVSRASSFVCGDLSINFETRQVRVKGEHVPLTPHEYRLLLLLVRNVGRVVPYQTILSTVWGPEYTEEVHYLRVYVRRLRRKLEENPSRPRHIRTVRGIGYRCCEQEEESPLSGF
jgi:two-component system, OmpR family, KDP operon response regulator KdpE